MILNARRRRLESAPASTCPQSAQPHRQDRSSPPPVSPSMRQSSTNPPHCVSRASLYIDKRTNQLPFMHSQSCSEGRLTRPLRSAPSPACAQSHNARWDRRRLQSVQDGIPPTRNRLRPPREEEKIRQSWSRAQNTHAQTHSVSPPRPYRRSRSLRKWRRWRRAEGENWILPTRRALPCGRASRRGGRESWR